MRQLTLKNSTLLAVIDDEDFDKVSKFQYVIHQQGTWGPYAQRPGGMYLHRDVFEYIPPGFEVDHIDSDGLNCQKSNLRLATAAQNRANSIKRDGCSTPYKGVCRATGRRKFTAYINYNHQRVALGQFEHPQEAAIHYDMAALKLYGEFAKLNFPENLEEYKEALGLVQ